MTLKQTAKDILLRKTWIRVAELNKIGSFKDKEKAILFGAPIPEEDKLPLRINTILGVLILALTVTIAIGIFSILVDIFLGILIVFLIILPVILKSTIKS